jgi:RNA polymerase primary sigma factor
MRQLSITARITNRETDSFNQYLKHIAEIDVLTPEDEIELTKKSITGDKKAIDELVCRNLRFVISVAKQYVTNEATLEDLVNEGNIGLIKAAELFRPEMGNRFISYAVFWIRKVILEYLANNAKVIRFPANKINALSKLDKKINSLEQKLGRTVDISEVVDEFGDELGKESVELLDILSTYTTSSMDNEVNDSEGSSFSDLMMDYSPNLSADYLTSQSDIKSDINRILDILKPRDRRIMVALYGLDGSIPLSPKEVGEEIGVTREMIRQIREKTLVKLKTILGDSYMKTYM